MPSKAPSIQPCCGSVLPAGARCPCRKQLDRDRKARHDSMRPSSSARGYTSIWESARARFLSMHGACSHPGCRANATVVDHRVPHRGDPSLFWDPENWQPLCAHHHNSAKQKLERRA
ncbi:MAG: HNH endonuclease [Amaricoccus sp.]